MNKKKIGVDFDDTFVKTTKYLLKFYNKKHKTKYKQGHMYSYAFDEILGLSRVEWRELETEFYNSDLHSQIPLRAGAVETLRAYSKKHDFEIVTARPKENMVFLEKTLEKHNARNLFTAVHSTGHMQNMHKRQKWEVCLEEGFILLIDDYPVHLNKAAEQGIPGLLMTTPWNKSFPLHKDVSRVHNWKDVGHFLKDL